MSRPVPLGAALAAATLFGALGTCGIAAAQSPAASACPDYFFLSGNVAPNADFETASSGIPAGTTTCWVNGDPTPPPSAADQWLMHSSNSGARVCSTLLPSTAPGHAPGSQMLLFRAGSNEGGIYQNSGVAGGHAYMFSAWVKVLRGQVALQSNGGNTGPVSWTSKVGEWEQLRVCTNSIGITDLLVIFNQDPAGGAFLVDRTELREIPIRE